MGDVQVAVDHVLVTHDPVQGEHEKREREHESEHDPDLVQVVERCETNDDGRICALGLDVLDEPREAPEHVQERDRRRRRAGRAHKEDVRVALWEVR